MDWLQALIAGVIQGITEFIPVSSSGHLVIYNTLFGQGDESNLAFSVFLHLATLLSVIIVFHEDVWMLIREFFTALADILRGKPDFKSPNRRFLLMVIIATIPAVLVGVLIKLLNMESILENIFAVAALLIITSVFLFLSDRLNKGTRAETDTPLKNAFYIGIFQAIAILPGISRSGSTIFGGLLGGLKKDFAVKLAFILSIPVILGAGLLELIDVLKADSISIDPVSWLTGFTAAAVCGVVAIKLIKLLIKKRAFYIFGIYCLLASAFAFLAGFGVIL